MSAFAKSAACLLLLASFPASADLFSPGDLARPHANLEGLDHCTACHPAGGQLSQETCLKCHTELAPRVAKGVGFHGRIPNEKRACEECHKDHQGRSYAMVIWPGGLKAFDHKKTGWPLLGKHQPAECKACHEKRLIFATAILQLLAKQPQRETFLGSPTECASCHFDEHRAQVSTDCATCHDEKGWTPVPGFNHRDTEYPLEGKHANVKCSACHPKAKDEATAKSVFPAPVSETFMKFSPLDHASCLDCHKDPHEGRFGPRCASCHTVNGWKLIRNASQERAFHEKTRYPLRGDHLDVDCKACHGPFPGQAAKFKGLPFANCTDCHVDAHLGQVAPKAGPKPVVDCGGCHSVEGFTPVRYPAEQHQKTRYPLEGAHQAVACSACHPKSAALAEKMGKAIRADHKRHRRPTQFSLVALDFDKPLAACESCHADVHDGQFKTRAGGCAGCHQVSSFHQVKFDHDKDSRYPLTGGHAKVECSKCHTPPAVGKPVKYAPLPMACNACHADVHVGQFAPAQGKPTACEKCHTEAAWSQLLFKHEPPFTNYLLDGKHAAVKCASCHPKLSVGRGQETVRYKPLAQTCEGCHKDFHQGAFKDFVP